MPKHILLVKGDTIDLIMSLKVCVVFSTPFEDKRKRDRDKIHSQNKINDTISTILLLF